MDRVDAYVSQPHFLDHIAPIWAALPDEMRGSFYADRGVAAHARRRGIEPASWTSSAMREQIPTLVAGAGDLVRTHRRPAIYMEHGAGQTYLAKHPSYAGSDARRHVELFLNPSDRVAGYNRVSRPTARQVTIGCPRLDRHHLAGHRRRGLGRPVIALTWHWNCLVAPETRGAFAHYRGALAELAAGPWEIIGHGHPRLFADPRLEQAYRAAGIEVVRDFEEVLERADLLVADNSSALYEFASTGRPVVVMNAPWYRRDVEHGLRFWEYADVGVQVDGPDELVAGIEHALADPPAQRRRREAVSDQVYAHRDGTAAQSAAAAIAEWLDAREERAAA